jgi:hypothetical protein
MLKGPRRASVAQLVEHRFRKPEVKGSSPFAGSLNQEVDSSCTDLLVWNTNGYTFRFFETSDEIVCGFLVVVAQPPKAPLPTPTF